MIPSKLTVAQIFEQERRLVVPLFQRKYVWDKAKQWQPLWEDIKQLAEEELVRATDSMARGRKKMPNHFIGAVVLANLDAEWKSVPARSVIDGQQRMTTLQIVLTALQDAAAAQEVKGVERTFERLTRNNCRTEQTYEQYKVWPTTGDQDVFARMMMAGSAAEVERLFPLTRGYRKRKYDPRPRLVEAYLYFEEEFTDYLIADDPSQDEPTEPSDELVARRVEALLESITRRLEVVMVELEPDDDPQVIFESLNGRGEPLLPSDLIRNYVFLEANKQQRDLVALHKKYWSEFDDSSKAGKFWQEETRQGRLKRPRLDLFFFHFLTLQRREQLPITQLYTEFRSWWQDAADSNAEAELASLRHYGDVYRRFFEGSDMPRLDLLVHRLQVMDTSVFYPVLLGLLTRWKEKVNQKELTGIFTDLESYLVRRLACEMTPKNYNRIVLDMLQAMEAASSIDRNTMRNFLMGLTGETGRWPDDTEFRDACQNKPLYQNLNNPRLQMLLHALDLQMETSRQERVHLETTLTIEHIFPQQPAAGKWDQIGPDDAEVVLHQLGNLTLLTKPLNSSVSNGPFSKKRGQIAKQSKLRLNAYFQEFGDDHLWGVKDIKKRGKELAQLAGVVWPRG